MKLSNLVEDENFVAWKRRMLLGATLLLLISFVVARIGGPFFPLNQVRSQDLPILYLLSVSLAIVSIWPPPLLFPEHLPGRVSLYIAATMTAVLLWVGTYRVLGNFPLSSDERMVVLDMAVFDGGHLASPLAPAWQPYAKALTPAFLLDEHMPRAVVSAYLPMNALIRSAFSHIADPALFNPLLAILGGTALLDISRRAFDGNPAACWATLLIYGLSAQVLITAMTPYSMTAHLALNLVWLAAFLREGRGAHAVAIVTGFVATGLHQLAFHPFFVAPFLLWRLRQGRWRLALAYAAAYLLIIIAWIYYPIYVGADVRSGPELPTNSSLLARIATAFAEHRGQTGATMFFNLIRFVAWQNLAFLPLVAAGIAVALRERAFAGVLVLGIVAWLAFITIVIPFQGHGWGYRYLHSYIGSFALIAGYGYRELRSKIGSRADDFVIGLSAVTAVVAIPLLLTAAHRFVAPHLALEEKIARQKASILVIDTELGPSTDGVWPHNAIENVRNAPDLSNRPLRFSSRNLDAEQLTGLCRMGSVELLTRADQHDVGFAPNLPEKSSDFERKVAIAAKEVPSCFKRPAAPQRA